jgi:hypothetical protein
MVALRHRREIQEVAVAVTISWLPLVLGSPHRLAYAMFAELFIARFAFQPPTDAPLTRRRRLVLIVLGWSALGCLAWSWLPLFLHRTA